VALAIETRHLYVAHMSAVRLVVVSDSHLSERTPEATTNWQAVVDHVAVTATDLVVHAGDITADGAVHPPDVEYAGRQVARLGAPYVVVAGNHDVGDIPVDGTTHGPPVDAAMIARFCATFGSDRFSMAVGAWWFLGLDAQALAAGGDIEAEHRAWAEREVAAVPAGAPVVVVSHRPLVPGPGDEDGSGRYLPPPARRWLLDLLGTVDVRLVVSGHIHQRFRHVHSGLDHLWVPTTWAVIPDALQRRVGDKVPGVTELVLHDDGRFDVATSQPPGVRRYVIGEDIESPYGPIEPLV
jgi:3',5'-cyclic AMP phosphodiesterase CpdA